MVPGEAGAVSVALPISSIKRAATTVRRSPGDSNTGRPVRGARWASQEAGRLLDEVAPPLRGLVSLDTVCTGSVLSLWPHEHTEMAVPEQQHQRPAPLASRSERGY